jgi:hypothetical protein
MRISKLGIRELALYVSSHLTKNGIDTVLSGGACVSIYTENKYVSSDLDFVLQSYEDQKRLRQILGKIDFYFEDGHFKHRKTEFFIEFLPPPASIGDEPIKEVAEIKKGELTLKLLSATDCVKDRLASFYHWNDRQALDQAILVAKYNPVDPGEIERWSKREGMSERYKIFRRQLRRVRL